MSDTAAVYLTADDGRGEALLLSDPSQLQKRYLILSDPQTGVVKMMVDREIFLADHSVVIGEPKTPTETPGKRRRFRKAR